LPACASLQGASAADGSSPVLAKKRWESEDRLPSGRSSTTRSIRCMGKKTTAGVNGSPSLAIAAISSNEASSTPLSRRPSGASARIIPQNFSRGLPRLTITSVPGINGSCVLAGAAGPRLDNFLSTQGLSPGEARIATPATGRGQAARQIERPVIPACRREGTGVCRSAMDAAVFAAPWLRSGECARGSRRTTGRLLPACAPSRPPCRSAS